MGIYVSDVAFEVPYKELTKVLECLFVHVYLKEMPKENKNYHVSHTPIMNSFHVPKFSSLIKIEPLTC